MNKILFLFEELIVLLIVSSDRKNGSRLFVQGNKVGQFNSRLLAFLRVLVADQVQGNMELQ